MKIEDLKAIDQLADFLSGTHAVAFSVISDKGKQRKIYRYKNMMTPYVQV